MRHMAKPRRNQPQIDIDKAGILEMFDALDAPRIGLWWFQFGPSATTNVFVWAGPGYRGLEDALEEAADWLADNAPGHLTTHEEMDELYAEAADDLGILWPPLHTRDDPDVEAVTEQAEADMTYTESGWLKSYEWSVSELADGDEPYAEVFEASVDEILGDLDEDDIERANAAAEQLGIDARWEWDED